MFKLPVLVAIVALAGLGVHDAITAARVADLAADGVIQAKLDSIPMAFDGWTGVTIVEDAAKAKANGYARLNRTYTRAGNHPAAVGLLIIAGPSGELGAHDPERCFTGTGYSPVGDRTRKTTIDGPLTHSLWARKFSTGTLPASTIEVAWGWTAEGDWKAADNARYEFAGRTLLYKTYLSRTISPSPLATDLDPDPLSEFLTSLAPLARTAIAGAK